MRMPQDSNAMNYPSKCTCREVSYVSDEMPEMPIDDCII